VEILALIGQGVRALQLSTMEKFKKFSFILATLFILIALAVKLSRPEWSNYSNIGVGIGVLFFLLSLYFERAELKTFFSARSTRYGLNSLVIILMVLGIVGVANWIVAQHQIKLDTTKNKQFSLSSLTVNALKNLKRPVKVTAFFSTQDDASRLKMKTLLDDYQSRSKMLEVKLIDPLRNLPLVRQYKIETNGTTIIESGTQKATVTTTQEEDLTNAILQVSTNKQITVYFLQGHGEPAISDTENAGFSAIVEQLKKSNYAVQELKDFAAKPKVPDNCDALIIASPSVQLLDHEIKGIQDYFAAGGRGMVLVDPRSDASMAKVLAPYQIQMAQDIVVDDNCNFPLAGPVVPCAIPKSGTPITKEFDRSAVLFLPESKSLEYKSSEGGKEVYTPVAESSPTSWGETDLDKAVFDEGKDKKGPLTMALLVTKPVEEKNSRSKEMRLAVAGDVSFLQNQFVGWSPWNYQMFANSVAWLTEQENLIHLPPKNARNDVMILSSGQLRFLGIVSILVIPLAIIGTGISVWLKRKKL
jgi:ABC-type uncharacterized transport system involved in gliding motility auxiliary subunit